MRISLKILNYILCFFIMTPQSSFAAKLGSMNMDVSVNVVGKACTVEPEAENAIISFGDVSIDSLRRAPVTKSDLIKYNIKCISAAKVARIAFETQLDPQGKWSALPNNSVIINGKFQHNGSANKTDLIHLHTSSQDLSQLNQIPLVNGKASFVLSDFVMTKHPSVDLRPGTAKWLIPLLLWHE